MKMDNKRIGDRPAFRFEYLAAGTRTQCIGGEAVNRLSRNTHNVSGSQATGQELQVPGCTFENPGGGLSWHDMKKAGVEDSGPKV
jgi:hypothetical protein